MRCTGTRGAFGQVIPFHGEGKQKLEGLPLFLALVTT